MVKQLVVAVLTVITALRTAIPIEQAHPEDTLHNYCKSVFAVEVNTKRVEPAENLHDWRLPTHIIPKRYDLSLYPNLETGLFRGAVVATVDVKKDSNEIKLHSSGLNIATVDIDGKKANAEADTKFELLIITLDDGGVIEEGEHDVNIAYNGDMKNTLVGMYKSAYIAENGEKRSISATNFQPTHARKAFPCFDEPAMKANFTVHILKPSNDASYIALSNMPQEEEETAEEQGIMVHFKESVQMSTYLACFIVCDFKYTEAIVNSNSDQIPLRVYATPAQVEKTRYALQVAKGVTEFFTKYFNIKYPLPKLDLIAVPDFEISAMEHWGLVTFRETSMFFDERKGSTANKLKVAVIVAHELAHSWFGNLVTMKWWGDLWLNEGFASYIKYKGVDAVHKEWQMLDQFLLEDFHPVLSLDATPASHPIINDVATPPQIVEVFDYITYKKGASLLRMLEAAVGEDQFQKGVTAYLEKHAWGNAETQDLWKELQKIVGPSRNVTTFMDTWTSQMGYPVLMVQEEEDRYVLTQKRFLKDPKDCGDTKSPYGYKWTIPVTYITNKDQESPNLVWFDYNEENLIIEKPSDIKWIKFNYKQIGYYRVNYPETTWKILADNINDMLAISDRTHLLEESFSIAESSDDLLGYNVPLHLTKYLKNETHYIPWSVAARKVETLRNYLVNDLEYAKYLEYLQSIVKPAYEAITWNESARDGDLRKRARATILELACSIGIPECKEEASNRFQNWLRDPEADVLLSDLRSVVHTYGMQDAGRDEWEKVLEIYKKEIDANEKLSLIRGLASVKEAWLLQRLLELAKDEQIIRRQDYFNVLLYVSKHYVGTLMVWDYVRENWDYLVSRFGLNDRHLGKLIPLITERFSSKTKRREMEAFFEAYPNAGAGAAARKEALAYVNNNIRWIERNKEDVKKWLNQNVVSKSPK